MGKDCQDKQLRTVTLSIVQGSELGHMLYVLYKADLRTVRCI